MMGQDALNNEKSALFEKIMSELAKQLKDNILFLIMSLVIGAGVVVCAVKHYALLGLLAYSVLFFVMNLIGCHSSHWLGKMAKAATAQELLSVYDKNMVFEKWKVVLYIVITILVSFYFLAFSNTGAVTSFMLLTAIPVSTYRSTVARMSDAIEDLRFL